LEGLKKLAKDIRIIKGCQCGCLLHIIVNKNYQVLVDIVKEMELGLKNISLLRPLIH
jgi:hypothetical protein